LKEPPAEITSWARPHLEDLGNSLLDEILPSGRSPADHQRIVAPYRAAFHQRLDGMLRDVEIGFVEGAGFARAEQVESKEEWIAAAEAVRLLKPVLGGEYTAQQTICKRAHSSLIRARAERFMVGDVSRNATEVPKDFWWAEGGSALTQNWTTGDFDTWVKRGEVHLRAFGVSFSRADIEKMIPAGTPTPAPSTAAGGRRTADWWPDLLIELCFRHFRGDLKPTKQADVERAMQQWISEHGFEAAVSTVRERARKLWQAIQREAEN
jgi:hypothetical protein